MKRPFVALLSLVLIAGLVEGTTAQSVLSIAGGAATVFEHTGPPGGACAYPTGPLLFAFPFPGVLVCPLPGAFAFGPLSVGDVGANRALDTVWVTNGLVVAEYTSLGVPLRSFPVPVGMFVPGPITGLDFAPGPGVLWITDGPFIAGLFPPAAPACIPPVVAVPAFPSPSPGPLTDVTWDPSSGSLWGCDGAGFVTNILIGGALGPFGFFPVGPAPCPLGAVPQGIAYDTTTPTAFGGPPVLYVTDGAIWERFIPGGAAAPPTFYSPASCYPVPPVAPASGLAFTLTPIVYGVGSDPTGLPTPVIGATGQSATPSGPMTITLAGAALAPGTAAALFYALGPTCPPIMFLGGNVLHLMPPLFGPLGPFPVVGGAVTFGPFALPPALPLGVSVYFQWLVGKGGGGFQASNGLEMTFGLP